MSFTVDKQTLEDLAIFGKHRGKSIYDLFNVTQTRGGAKILEQMFGTPFSDVEKITRRSAIISYFKQNPIAFPFRNEWFDSAEYYLDNADSRTQIALENNGLQRKVKSMVGGDTEFNTLCRGILATLDILHFASAFLEKYRNGQMESVYTQEMRKMDEILTDEHLNRICREQKMQKLTYQKAAELDQVLRYTVREKIKHLFWYLYNLDVYISVAQVAVSKGFVFAKALPAADGVLNLEGVFHPLLAGAKANTIRVDKHNNLIFLTGANMAGKSTFMKSFGVVLFLAHIGFPVPANKMEFSVRSGMYTTINLPDNLSMGYSHFYAEVLRVKKVAEYVARTGNMIVVFDELFRGTNVKDAYDATVAIAGAFAEKKDSIFMISTHIIEAGEELKKSCDNIQYVYLPTIMKGNVPEYTYKLTPGITNDRHGMLIVNNEGIIEMLKKNVNQKNLK